MKPIRFNTEMVKAILEDRKTETRMVVKLPKDLYVNDDGSVDYQHVGDGGHFNTVGEFAEYFLPHHQPGDILYVKETWQDLSNNEGEYVYFADGDEGLEDKGWGVITTKDIKWRPSIHMPRKAARIFLKVTGVRVERLQDMDDDEAWREGVLTTNFPYEKVHLPRFVELWNSTIKKQDLDRYGWEANPWVRVIEFEREGDLNERRRP